MILPFYRGNPTQEAPVPRSRRLPRLAATALLSCLLVHCSPQRAPDVETSAPVGAIVGTPDPALLRLLVGARVGAPSPGRRGPPVQGEQRPGGLTAASAAR
ncbi:hypothetical protein BH11MYX4_BH11MYX4_24130 [soil metagenome]